MLQDGNGPERQAGKHRHDDGEDQRPAVNGDLIQPRQSGRIHAEDELERGDRESDPGGSAQQSEEQTLDEHLPGQASTSGAERGPHGEFLGAAFGSDQ